MIDFAQIDDLTRGRLGKCDVACPACGPMRRSPVNRKRRVLRIWRVDTGFASFHCARCGEKGFAREDGASLPDPIKFERARAEAEQRDKISAAEQSNKALWFWKQRRPIAGTKAETYLRGARGYRGPLPATLGFLPARGKYGPAMIAAFGISDEPEPGVLAIADEAVRGVHITRLAPDGSGKAGTDNDKIMLGRSIGFPIVLAPPNDVLGLSVAEGIEDALSTHASTGLGAWAAGSASRLPALADVVPNYIEAITIVVDDDVDGRRHANALAESLGDRGIGIRMAFPVPAAEAA